MIDFNAVARMPTFLGEDYHSDVSSPDKPANWSSLKDPNDYHSEIEMESPAVQGGQLKDPANYSDDCENLITQRLGRDSCLSDELSVSNGSNSFTQMQYAQPPMSFSEAIDMEIDQSSGSNEVHSESTNTVIASSDEVEGDEEIEDDSEEYDETWCEDDSIEVSSCFQKRKGGLKTTGLSDEECSESQPTVEPWNEVQRYPSYDNYNAQNHHSCWEKGYNSDDDHDHPKHWPRRSYRGCEATKYPGLLRQDAINPSSNEYTYVSNLERDLLFNDARTTSLAENADEGYSIQDEVNDFERMYYREFPEYNAQRYAGMSRSVGMAQRFKHMREQLDEIQDNYPDPYEDSHTDTDKILNECLDLYGREKTTIDIDHVNFVMNFKPEDEFDSTREIAVIMLAKVFGVDAYAEMYNIRPLSDGRLWSFMKANPLLPECAQKKEILLLKRPINIAILKCEAKKTMKCLNDERRGIPLNPNWRRFGFLVDTMSSGNTPWFADILGALLKAEVSYIHVVGIGMRWKIGTTFRPAETFFKHLTQAKEDGVDIYQIQFDVSITTYHADEERAEDEEKELYRLPKWIAGTKRPLGTLPLGQGLTKSRYPLWNFDRTESGHFANQQSGCVTLAFDSAVNGSYLTPESKGVYQFKCYITAAHVSRNALPRLPNPNWPILPETIIQAKRMLPLLRKVAIEVNNDENVHEYGHRMEMSWKSRRAIKITEWVDLDDLMKLAMYGRKEVLNKYSIAPMKYKDLPVNNRVQTRAMVLLGQITREVMGSRDIALLKRVYGEGKQMWLSAMMSQLYICCGLTGRRVSAHFKNWTSSGASAYDPDGYRLLWDPPEEYDFVTEGSPMDREGNSRFVQAVRFCELAKLARLNAVERERVLRLCPTLRNAYLGDISNLMHDQIVSAIRLSSIHFINRMNRGVLPYFSPTIFDEVGEIDEQIEEPLDHDEMIEQEELMNDAYLDEGLMTEQESIERMGINLPRIFPVENNGDVVLLDNAFPEMNSVDWWHKLCQIILDTEDSRDQRTIDANHWVIQTLNEGKDIQTPSPFWTKTKVIERVARNLNVSIPNDKRRRSDLIHILAEYYNFYPEVHE
jgi:hypothetical protein